MVEVYHLHSIEGLVSMLITCKLDLSSCPIRTSNAAIRLSSSALERHMLASAQCAFGGWCAHSGACSSIGKKNSKSRMITHVAVCAIHLFILGDLISFLPFDIFLKFENLNHRLGWIEMEDELLTVLLWTDSVLLAVRGAKGHDSTFWPWL